jgi:hypothetical protein
MRRLPAALCVALAAAAALALTARAQTGGARGLMRRMRRSWTLRPATCAPDDRAARWRIASIGTTPPRRTAPPRVDLGGRSSCRTHRRPRAHRDAGGDARRRSSSVCTARSAGVSHFEDVGLRELVKKGYLPGPDLLAAGYHVRPQPAPEAFLDAPDLGDLMKGLTTPDALRRFVRFNLGRGADWIKVLATERRHADTDRASRSTVKRSSRWS